MRGITRTRRAVTAVVAGTGLVLALGACGDGDSGTDEASQTDAGTGTGEGADGEAATATEAAGPAADQVTAAREGLAAWLAENEPETPSTSATIPDCPAIGLERMEEALGVVGYEDTSLGSWGTEIEWSEYEALHPDLMGIACGGDSDGDTNDSEFGTAGGVLAVDLSGRSDFESFLAAAGLSESRSVEPPEDVGGELRVGCFDDGPEFCVALWHSDGLVLGSTLIAEGADEERVHTLLEEVLPDLLDQLAQV